MTPLPIMWLGSLFEQTWVLHHLRMIPHKVKFFWSIFLYRSLCTNLTPFPSLWPNSIAVEIWIFTTLICFHTSYKFSSHLVFNEKIFKKCKQIFNNSWLSPLLKKACLLFARMVVVSFVEISTVFLEKMLKMGNVYDDNISNDDCDSQQRNFDRESSQLLSALMSWKLDFLWFDKMLIDFITMSKYLCGGVDILKWANSEKLSKFLFSNFPNVRV